MDTSSIVVRGTLSVHSQRDTSLPQSGYAYTAANGLVASTGASVKARSTLASVQAKTMIECTDCFASCTNGIRWSSLRC
jgi:hypothetical protein